MNIDKMVKDAVEVCKELKLNPRVSRAKTISTNINVYISVIAKKYVLLVGHKAEVCSDLKTLKMYLKMKMS